jgi:hypothetical protein
MKRILLAATLMTAIGIGRLVSAQTPAPKADEHAAHHPAKTAAAAPTAAPNDVRPTPGGMAGGGNGMMAGGMMGGGMMGSGMMAMMDGGMCPMMGGAKTNVDVKKTEKGVTITLTSTDAATATRLQKMAEAMRLMHEAMAQ